MGALFQSRGHVAQQEQQGKKRHASKNRSTDILSSVIDQSESSILQSCVIMFICLNIGSLQLLSNAAYTIRNPLFYEMHSVFLRHDDDDDDDVHHLLLSVC